MLATKVGLPVDEDPNHRGASRRWITQSAERSLRRLQTDWIDLYQVHRLDPTADVDETLGALPDLVHAGKIRAFGASKVPASEIVEAQWTAERRGRERFRSEQPPTRCSSAPSRTTCCRPACAAAWASRPSALWPAAGCRAATAKARRSAERPGPSGLSAYHGTLPGKAFPATLQEAKAEEPVSGNIPFTVRAKNAMESAVREAFNFGHNYICTEHLLLGILDDPHCPRRLGLIRLSVAETARLARLAADWAAGHISPARRIQAALVRPATAAPGRRPMASPQRTPRYADDLIQVPVRRGLRQPEPSAQPDVTLVDDREEVVITRAGHEPVVIVALADYESLKETAYLLRSPENARRLLASIDRLEHGGGIERDLLE